MESWTKKIIYLIIKELFKELSLFFLIYFFILVFLEDLKQGFVTLYLNLNMFLYSGLFCLIIMLLISKKVREKKSDVVVPPPGVIHRYKCISKIMAYLINLPNKLYRGKEKTEEINEIK